MHASDRYSIIVPVPDSVGFGTSVVSLSLPPLPFRRSPRNFATTKQLQAYALYYRFFTSVAHPSIPSPRLPKGTATEIPSIPFVPSRNLLPLIPPAFALLTGSSSNIGMRKSAIRFASSTLKWYFSLNTSGKAQWRSR